jgi:hypothetical protein
VLIRAEPLAVTVTPGNRAPVSSLMNPLDAAAVGLGGTNGGHEDPGHAEQRESIPHEFCLKELPLSTGGILGLFPRFCKGLAGPVTVTLGPRQMRTGSERASAFRCLPGRMRTA